MRWEPYVPEYYNDKEVVLFSMSDFLAAKKSQVFTNAPAGLTFPGDPGWSTGNSFSHPELNRWAPRLGLVFDPAGNGRATVRASYGILFDGPSNYYANFVSTGPPWGNLITNTNLPGGFTNPWQVWPGGNPFPGQLPPPPDAPFQPFSTYTTLLPHLHPPYMQQWNITFQKQIGANWLASASYLGNKTTHMWLSNNINPSVYIPGVCGGGACSTSANTNNRRVLNQIDPVNGGYYGIVLQTFQGANANYNAMLVSLQHRFSRNYSVLMNYTYSHCINDGDAVGDISNTPNVENPYNVRQQRGSCASDRRKIFNSSFIANTPEFSSKLLRAAVTGWQLAPIFTASTGGYSTITTGTDTSFTGIGIDMPNLVGPLDATGAYNHWFNTSAVQVNAPGTYGNIGRAVLRQPSIWNIDMSLVRTIPLRENHNVEFRAEAFNLPNHPNWTGGFHTAMNDPLFGTINSASDPRILQLSLKYKF